MKHEGNVQITTVRLPSARAAFAMDRLKEQLRYYSDKNRRRLKGPIQFDVAFDLADRSSGFIIISLPGIIRFARLTPPAFYYKVENERGACFLVKWKKNTSDTTDSTPEIEQLEWRLGDNDEILIKVPSGRILTMAQACDHILSPILRESHIASR